MPLFRPNSTCEIRRATGRTLYNEPTGLTPPRTAGCAIIKAVGMNEKSTVRADSSASRGAAGEVQFDAKILVLHHVDVKVDDQVKLRDGTLLRVIGTFLRHNLDGKPDHTEVFLNIWNKE